MWTNKKAQFGKIPELESGVLFPSRIFKNFKRFYSTHINPAYFNRKLLGETGLLKYVKLNLQISDWCGGLPFKWNKSKLETKSHRKLSIFSF